RVRRACRVRDGVIDPIAAPGLRSRRRVRHGRIDGRDFRRRGPGALESLEWRGTEERRVRARSAGRATHAPDWTGACPMRVTGGHVTVRPQESGPEDVMIWTVSPSIWPEQLTSP